MQIEETKINEKNEIEKSKISSDIRRNLDITSKGIIVFLVILTLALIITLFVLYSMNEYKIDDKMIDRISLSTYVCVIVTFILVLKFSKNKIKKIVFNLLTNKYGIIRRLNLPSTKIVEGKKTEVGNVRHKYFFSYEVDKYNCIFSNYYKEKLRIRRSIGREKRSYYHYQKIANIMEYCYSLKLLGIGNITNDILFQPKVKQAIESLSEIKIINVSIKNEYLIVEKETILNNYNSKDAEIDVKDIELFYNEIVKEILRKVKDDI